MRKIGKIPYSMDRLKKPGDAVDRAGDIANGEVVGDIGAAVQGNWDRLSFDKEAALHHPALLLQVDYLI